MLNMRLQLVAENVWKNGMILTGSKKLDEENLKYLIEIVMIYLEKRLPHLNKIEAKN